MGKLVVLSLDGDSQQQGFQLRLEIAEEGSRATLEMTGYLPAASQLTTYLQYHWREKYRSLGSPARIQPGKIIYGGSINQQLKECRDSAHELGNILKRWLDSEQFRPIDKRLREELNPEETIRVLIRTENTQLQKLPWHLWDFFDRYPKAEVALSGTQFKRPHQLPTPTSKSKVRILAILGHSAGIDIKADRQLLENLPNAETVFLVEPKHHEINDQLWEQAWDIIFFAGHSETEGETGRIYINPTDSLTIDELWYALKKAVAQGLKLAIFNSCDGLGLARKLHDLQIPQMIIMRELVPDQVAQNFLKYFLKGFANGKSLYLAAREARERLQGLERQFPCASWLPVIYQNLAQEPPAWADLCQEQEKRKPKWPSFQRVLLSSIVVTSLVMVVRSLGLFQPWELQGFDQLMRLRPNEGPDPRLLLVTITEKDVQSQPKEERRAASLSDRSLAKLLAKLEQYQPSAIGLDIYRENPVAREYQDLATRMQTSDHLFAICHYGDPGVPPPPEVPEVRQGFNNVLLDPDDIIRRHLLAVGSPSPCQSYYSFNFQLATGYLADQAIQLEVTENYLKLGTTVFKTLEKDSGGYHNLKSGGHQILLNYRASDQIAETVSLGEVLRDDFNADLVRNRIVVIGTIAPSFNDDMWRTPYSGGQFSLKTMTGIEIQAHMISHILSAVLDNRPLIWWWSEPGEALWIWCWAVVGGMVAGNFNVLRPVLLGTGTALVVLYGSCWVLLIVTGGWVPLIPATIALVATSVVLYFGLQSDQSN
ncbi:MULTISPECIES: CHASE2 domain-containing protein [Moorena]|uniref:Putative transmembrane sensor domain protein n=1 Tax=Moorena producens 3L TaxID=489825 RepID=F4XLL2_9CYAN|nr:MULTISPECIES: CHASE2 domain-containing protein [Moorena]EGJ34487.1 putative transmembrane sensor domain protein [Moorena producens 3L]NEP69428.1 CHASE2 domain-containing protein [Moorena sp. SIO3A5]NEQ06785.1 CHASE2 domain-containing protein [Moorena sp. SIO4E2]OLT68232.1 adenylate cyclase [Moorena producens 3L]